MFRSLRHEADAILRWIMAATSKKSQRPARGKSAKRKSRKNEDPADYRLPKPSCKIKRKDKTEIVLTCSKPKETQRPIRKRIKSLLG